jgi:hypothetical protein
MRVSIRSVAMATIAVVLAAVSLGYAQANFAGSWVLDPSQSQLPSRHSKAAPDAGQTTTPPALKLTVEQTGDMLKATRSVARGNRERSISESYTVDGSEHSVTGRHNSTVATKATWDGARLRINTNRTMTDRSGQQIQVVRESVWSLSPDGQTLTIETTVQGPRGQNAFKSVYQRA